MKYFDCLGQLVRETHDGDREIYDRGQWRPTLPTDLLPQCVEIDLDHYGELKQKIDENE